MSCISFGNLCPSSGDSEQVLLSKILQSINEGGGGLVGVSSINVNGTGPQTGAVSLTIPGGTVTSVNGDPGPAVSLDSGEIPEGANLYFTEARVRGTDLAGFVAAPGVVTAADTVLSAIEKLVGNGSSSLINFTDENADADAVIWTNSGVDEIFRVVGATGNIQLTGTNKRVHLAIDTTALALIGGAGKGTAGFIELYGQDEVSGIGGATISIHNGGQFRVRSAPQSSTVSVVRSALDATTGFSGIGPLTTLAGLFHVNSETTDTLAILEQATADTSAISLHLRKARGSLSGRGIIVTGDELGNIPFDGYDGTNFLTAASIEAVATGTVAATRVPGELRFRTATNAAPSVLTTALTINNAQQVVVNDGTETLPSLVFGAAVNTGFFRPSGNILDISVSSTSQIRFATDRLTLRSTVLLGWTSGTAAGTRDVLLGRDAAGILALSNTTVAAQTFRVYETTDAGLTNYSRLSLQTQTSPGNILIRSEAAGTALVSGQPRILQVGTGPSVGTDIAGQSAILHGGQGTGSGVGGSILFQSSAAAGSSAVLNALATVASINNLGSLTIRATTATPAGGTTGAGLRFGTTANFGVFYGSGAPSLSAAQGSLYLRSDGTTTNDRAYINTDGGTTWTALTTVA